MVGSASKAVHMLSLRFTLKSPAGVVSARLTPATCLQFPRGSTSLLCHYMGRADEH
jgi:hypothetical protein